MSNHPAYYQNYTEEQFAADEYFQQWVLQPDNDNDHFWESYLLLHPGQQETIAKARTLVTALAVNNYGFSPLTAGEKAAIKEDHAKCGW